MAARQRFFEDGEVLNDEDRECIECYLNAARLSAATMATSIRTAKVWRDQGEWIYADEALDAALKAQAAFEHAEAKIREVIFGDDDAKQVSD